MGSAATSGRLLLRPLNHSGGSGLRQSVPTPPNCTVEERTALHYQNIWVTEAGGRTVTAEAAEALKDKRTRRRERNNLEPTVVEPETVLVPLLNPTIGCNSGGPLREIGYMP